MTDIDYATVNIAAKASLISDEVNDHYDKLRSNAQKQAADRVIEYCNEILEQVNKIWALESEHNE